MEVLPCDSIIFRSTSVLIYFISYYVQIFTAGCWWILHWLCFKTLRKDSTGKHKEPVLTEEAWIRPVPISHHSAPYFYIYVNGNPQPIEPPAPITVFLSCNLPHYFSVISAVSVLHAESQLYFVSQAAYVCVLNVVALKVNLFHLLCSRICVFHYPASYIFHRWPLFTRLIAKCYLHAKVKAPSSGWQGSLQRSYYRTGSSGSYLPLAIHLSQERAIKLPEAEFLEHLRLWKNKVCKCSTRLLPSFCFHEVKESIAPSSLSNVADTNRSTVPLFKYLVIQNALTTGYG